MREQDPILRDVETVLEYGGREVIWDVPEESQVIFGSGDNPFAGMTVTHWSHD